MVSMIMRDFRGWKLLTPYYALCACKHTNRRDRKYICIRHGIRRWSSWWKYFGTESESRGDIVSRRMSGEKKDKKKEKRDEREGEIDQTQSQEDRRW